MTGTEGSVRGRELGTGLPPCSSKKKKKGRKPTCKFSKPRSAGLVRKRDVNAQNFGSVR
jgi:hypothetical protein